ncbi:MAG: hypothetical protein LBD77_03160 [Bifidobacteriaceae bacterium]|jgi:hypothetical protein|nr:hypothetical protein [Bifidobacteriaceae bacterium]
MIKDQGTRVWLGHLAAVGAGLGGLVLVAHLAAGALGGLVIATLSSLMP